MEIRDEQYESSRRRLRSKGGPSWVSALLACIAWLAAGVPAHALDADEALGFERTPPRLSFTEGEVSFFRSGADDWTPAFVNTPLAAGDELYTDDSAKLEIQAAARVYLRAGEHTQFGLESVEPDFLQLRVTSGTVSLDLRSLEAGQTFELDTPNAAFTIEHTGYYRVVVDGEATTFSSRRGGRALLTQATGESFVVAASEQVIVVGDYAARIERRAAPDLDSWDRWNYARSDERIHAVSARYVPAAVYGVDDLDRHGDWRVVPTYGPIWVPRSVPTGWAPYSTGRWLWDPYYGWTWVDNASWGWAPFHYGRWVRVSGYWGWSPGPIVARPYYAPALVAFYSGGGSSIGFRFGSASVGWVALGWGEPIVPWWGPASFRAQPRWAGWGGPRYVNHVSVKKNTVIRVSQINVYQNARERDAFVTVDRDHFGRRDRAVQYKRGRADDFEPERGDFSVRPDRSSLVADSRSAGRPPRGAEKRRVVAIREPRRDPTPEFEPRRNGRQPSTDSSRGKRDARDPSPDSSRGKQSGRDASRTARPAVRVVKPTRSDEPVVTSSRPPFGQRGEGERAKPRAVPRVERSTSQRREDGAPPTRKPEQRVERTAARAPRTPRRETAPAPPAARETAARETTRDSPPRSKRRQDRQTARPTPRVEAEPQSRVAHSAPKRSKPERSKPEREETRERSAARTRDHEREPDKRDLGERGERPEKPKRSQSESPRTRTHGQQTEREIPSGGGERQRTRSSGRHGRG